MIFPHLGPVLTDIGKKFGEYVAGNRSVTYNIYSAVSFQYR